MKLTLQELTDLGKILEGHDGRRETATVVDMAVFEAIFGPEFIDPPKGRARMGLERRSGRGQGVAIPGI